MRNRFKNIDLRLKNGGFTLIEILVVIAVAAMIMTMATSNFLGARVKSRDARRKADLETIRKGLELFKLDQNPVAYPASAFMASLCNLCWSSDPGCTGNIYTRKLPCDPQTNNPYTYTLGADVVSYTLTACLENTKDTNRDASNLAVCSSQTPVKVSYTVNEP